MADAAGIAVVMMGGPIVIIVVAILYGIAYFVQPYMPDYDLQSIMIIEVLAIIGLCVGIFGVVALVGQVSGGGGGGGGSARSRH
jgi:hypothetical protein